MTLTDHDKAQIEKIKPNTKIRILSEEHSEYVQRMAFEAGFEWTISGKEVRYTDEPCLLFRRDNTITWDSEIKIHVNYKEIFIDLPPKESKIAEYSLSTASKIKPPFKFRNANLPVVREWLKDQGYRFMRVSRTENPFGYVEDDGFIYTGGEDTISGVYGINLTFDEIRFPELIFNIETKITSISIDNSKEIAKLESELESLNNKVSELEYKLSNLKS